MSKLRQRFLSMLAEAGIEEGDKHPWDIQIRNPDLYRRVLRDGSLGLGEAYMEGWWECAALDEFFTRVLRFGLHHKASGISQLLLTGVSRVMNLQSPKRSQRVARQHYDIGNDLYAQMLDTRMMYSCGYWRDAANLNEAQEHKLDLIACKLDLQPGMRVLDIGCGWGGGCEYFAERHGVEAVGITLSTEQADFARERCKNHPVEVFEMDYRDLPPDDRFDAIYSIGMFEHVGFKNYTTFMEKVYRLLSEEGLFLLHTIGSNTTATATDAWINRYVFPGGMLPSIPQIGRTLENFFVMEDWHNFGLDYDRTLLEWRKNFERGWEKLDRQRYDDRFFRMWQYYLNCCAGSFRSRQNQLWQILLSKDGRGKSAPVCR